MRITLVNTLIFAVVASACSGSGDKSQQASTQQATSSQQVETISAVRNSQTGQLIGRYDLSGNYSRATWSGTAARTHVTGNEISVRLDGDSGVYFDVLVDEMHAGTFVTVGGENLYPLASWTQAGERDVEIYRRNEGTYGIVSFLGFESSGTLKTPDALARRIEYIGDSLTCGYGIEGDNAYCEATATNENAYSTYAAVTARTLKAQASIICRSGKGVTRNWDGSTDETMSVLYNRTLTTVEQPKWDFHSAAADAVVINLGTNDFWGGATASEFVDSYKQLIGRVRSNYPNALIVAITWSNWGADKEALVNLAVTESGDVYTEQVRFAPDAADGYGCAGHTNTVTNAKLGQQLSERLQARLGW